MYSETGLMLPYSHNFPQFQKFDEVYFPENLHAPSEVMDSLLLQTPSPFLFPDYYTGDEYRLFKSPEEPLMGLDPMASFGGGVVIGPQAPLSIPEIESVGELLSDVYYECKKDLVANVGTETPPLSSEVVGVEAHPIQKSVSTSCLRSIDVGPEPLSRPKFIDFSLLDFGSVNGMRRAYSDGDIKNLGGDYNTRSSIQRAPATIFPSNGVSAREDRKEKLSRYRQKRSMRNFGRKIKYACRKALADSQPRIRGRFAKTEDFVHVSVKKQ